MTPVSPQHSPLLAKELAQSHAKRSLERCKILSTLSQMQGGIHREYLSKQHKECNRVTATWMSDAGMQTWQDEVGNLWGRLESTDPNAKRLIIGSHLDTVPNAGAYDGILGVLLAIEVAALAHKLKLELPFHLDVVGFCDEEGTRFATTLIGSKALANEFDPQWLNIEDTSGVTMRQAMLDFGLTPDDFTKAALNKNQLLGYWETHIEQGPVLESVNQALGVVTAIAGAKRAMISLTGQSGHAGTTPMNLRQDSLAGCAELTLAIEQLAKHAKNGEVATVGQIHARPGATNVIAGTTTISLDARAQNDQDLTKLLTAIQSSAEQIAKQRNLTLDWQWTHAADAVACDEKIQQLFASACKFNQQASPALASGAGHDAMAIAAICPVGMLFIRSPGGISHHPAEAVIDDDVTKALSVLYSSLVLYVKELNS
ncbi:MAG: allantoate amidohydrolase [Pseudoalteromonas prydzensis]|uniref:Allantoate amidohydrolase n=1 Tax=Pseudoalteromonas prydzensis TaxID=182141 RepID=A0A7V1CZL7_9GAMM|nr:allantoate amidohydrolase [Pseudoalteromonas prydzensis]HEA17202.1 allantoate amidohydrolase [Pseudoalteromonas prydzensis]